MVTSTRRPGGSRGRSGPARAVLSSRRQWTGLSRALQSLCTPDRGLGPSARTGSIIAAFGVPGSDRIRHEIGKDGRPPRSSCVGTPLAAWFGRHHHGRCGRRSCRSCLGIVDFSCRVFCRSGDICRPEARQTTVSKPAGAATMSSVDLAPLVLYACYFIGRRRTSRAAAVLSLNRQASKLQEAALALPAIDTYGSAPAPSTLRLLAARRRGGPERLRGVDTSGSTATGRFA